MSKPEKTAIPIYLHRKITFETLGNLLNTIDESLNAKMIKASLLIKHILSHNGKKIFFPYYWNTLKIRDLIFQFFIGMLYAILRVPIFKRKIEMENFEGKVNYNLLHTYLYVSYLDTVNAINNIELTKQKNSYLKQLCFNTSFSDILCLNLICNDIKLTNS